MLQKTIKNKVSLNGIGLHTGKNVTMTFLPAPENHGIKFQRIDTPEGVIIPADITRVVSTNRGTAISSGAIVINTVEHALSALAGLGIDNVLIEIDGPEVPILDGSAIPFINAIETVGVVEQTEEKDYFIVTEPISFKDEVTGSEMLALPADEFEVTALIDFGSPVLGQQFA
ncbi:MAG: UDP-3-O-acyl-N-acetylglucosamine deacetylase, partial [Saprospiraceae bacterium]